MKIVEGHSIRQVWAFAQGAAQARLGPDALAFCVAPTALQAAPNGGRPWPFGWKCDQDWAS